MNRTKLYKFLTLKNVGGFVMKARLYIGLTAAALLTCLISEAQVNDSRNYNNDYPGTIINNYYDNDCYYASRINRFHRSYSAFDYYSPVFTDNYWYGYEPFSWGVSLYGSIGFGFGIGFGLGFSYNYPGYYGWGYPYFSGSYYWGYNPYYYGYGYPHSSHWGYGNDWHHNYYSSNEHNQWNNNSRRGYDNHNSNSYHNDNSTDSHFSNPGHNGKTEGDKNNSQNNNAGRRERPNFTQSDFNNTGKNKAVNNNTWQRREISTVTQSDIRRGVNSVTANNLTRSGKEVSSSTINRSVNVKEVNSRNNKPGGYQNRNVSNYSIAPNVRRSTDVIGQTHNQTGSRSVPVAQARSASRSESITARPLGRSTFSQNAARPARVVSSPVKSSSSSAGHGSPVSRRSSSARSRS
jgi:hypothetical protein